MDTGNGSGYQSGPCGWRMCLCLYVSLCVHAHVCMCVFTVSLCNRVELWTAGVWQIKGKKTEPLSPTVRGLCGSDMLWQRAGGGVSPACFGSTCPTRLKGHCKWIWSYSVWWFLSFVKTYLSWVEWSFFRMTSTLEHEQSLNGLMSIKMIYCLVFPLKLRFTGQTKAGCFFKNKYILIITELFTSDILTLGKTKNL